MRFNIPLALGTATLLLLCSAHAERNHPCDRNGFLELGDNEQEFLSCELNSDGDYSVHRMRCQDDMIFRSQLGRCVSSVRFVQPADGSDIENPTVPPDNLDESTTDVVPGTTKESPFDDGETSEDPENSESTTNSPESSESTASTESSDATENTESSEGSDATDSSESTASTEGSDATENTESTEGSDATDSSESTASTEGSDATDDTESSESTASTEGSDATDDTESSESTASTEGSDATDDTESSESTATTEGSDTTGSTEIPRCATTGSFSISGDCSKYLLCYASESDDIGSIVQDCPSTMKFNPRNRYCEVGYTCS